MKRILHALAALWPGRPKWEDRSPKTEDRSWKTGDRWKTGDGRPTTEKRSWKADEWGLSHEGLWLPEARNGLLRHLNAMMRMGETVRELATRECVHVPSRESAEEQPSEYANQRISTSAKKSELADLQISSTNQQSDESTPKKADNRLPKRVIVSEREHTVERIGEPLPIAQVLARVYLRDTPRCAMGDAGRPSALADPRIGESATQQVNAPAHNRSGATLTALVFTVFMCLIAAQSRVFGTAAFLNGEDLPALNVGDPVPDSWWDMPLTLWTAADDQTETVTLGDYRGKAIILDFWATWCSNCISGMPHLFKMQDKFGEDVIALPVTSEDTDYVSRFVSASSSNRLIQVKPVFHTVTDNRTLLKHFPMNNTLPLMVVISKNGLIDAVTDARMLTDEYITALVANRERYAPLKRSRIEQVPPLLDFSLGDLRQYKPVFYTSLMGELDGVESLKEIVPDSVNGTVRFLLANHTILELYGAGRYGDTPRKFAFAGSRNYMRRILEVKDPRNYDHYLQDSTKRITVFDNGWNRAHRYTYESVVPLSDAESLKSRIVDDLNHHFGLRGRIENRRVEVWVLKKGERLQLNTQGKFLTVQDGWIKNRLSEDVYVGANEQGFPHYVSNIDSKFLAASLTRFLNQHTDGINVPYIVDELGLEGEWKTSFGLPDFEESITLQELVDILEDQGLILSVEEREIPMFVLTEPGYEAKPGERLVLTQSGYVPESRLDRVKPKL